MGWLKAVEVGGRLLPSLIEAVAELIDAGRSPEEAEALVKRDIKSRVEKYERERAEDEASLEAKHVIPRCAKCGRPEDDHHRRHPFVSPQPPPQPYPEGSE